MGGALGLRGGEVHRHRTGAVGDAANAGDRDPQHRPGGGRLAPGEPVPALATADYTCRETSGYLAAYRAAWVRAQQEFYDTHKEDVDAYVEFLAQNVG